MAGRADDGLQREGRTSPGYGAAFSLLERNWRRVASTHTLQDLMSPEPPTALKEACNWNLLTLGCVFFICGVLVLVAGVFAIAVSPFLPPMATPWLAAVQADRYYQLLIPLSVPVTIAAVALNWFSMKLFKHNS